ncbi:putative ABC transporter, permease [Bifidobacterium magnum]|uniref:Putative ABC transporter, permease n=1 Tax=Bifidobacterium magnum TaxID=1692 RepID=A0A087BE53_9BIFI|nr:hypothetical protein [Bifidobacterium magnum]KFI69303.1 putative ABC transporter, permease [Bifidobacterium magnum]
MWTTFITTLKINLRAKSAVFWMFCFPIVLSTMFMGMFGNLDKQYHVEPMRFAAVTDHAFCNATAARQLLRSLERDSMETLACQALPEQTAQAGEASELRDLLVLQPVDTATQAQTLINADPSVHGYVQVDGEGMMHTVISRTTVSDAGNATNGASLPISLSILNEVTGTKIGLSTALACVCSLFTGLYGSPAMRLSETIQRDAPALAIINPAQQITNLFYDILYYDSYEPFWRTIIILLAMTVLCLAAATAFLRRQRYEHL